MEMLSPKSKRALLVFFHLTGWLVFIYITMPGASGLERLPEDPLFPWLFGISYLFLIAYFYCNSNVFVPLLSKKKIVSFLGVTIAVYLLFCFAIPWIFRQYFLLELPFRHTGPMQHPDFSSPDGHFHPSQMSSFERIKHLGIFSRSSQLLVVFIVSTGLKVMTQWYAEKQRLLDLENSMIQAELSFLKSQIHPHFLFNSLNSIYYLALSKDDKAPKAILSLSDFLRFVTTESDNSLIPLEKEIKMLEEYLNLQSLRASEKFELQFHRKGNFSSLQIMPLTFIPFVENAFKYGISAHTDCFIHLNIEVERNILAFTIANSIPSGQKITVNSSGIGLENIKKRLELAYPERYTLNIQYDRQCFNVSLQIELERCDV
ncbi:MAG: sensor histidine kinase [Dysgonamonadaceae bacterium]|jgi:LytS/YehU family sensor histidine kinase|nr:sensor histidine kinase [Dysgonamonadaceae bacterium]